MDYYPVNEALKALWWLVPVAFIISFLKSRWFKGYLGELVVRFSAKLLLPREHYHSIHKGADL